MKLTLHLKHEIITWSHFLCVSLFLTLPSPSPSPRLVPSISRYFYSSFYYWMCFERFKVENEKEKKQKKHNSNQPHRPNVYTFILVESQWNYLYVWMNVMKSRSTKVSFIHFRRSRLRGFSCNRMEYLAITKIKWNEITKKEHTHTIQKESRLRARAILNCA